MATNSLGTLTLDVVANTGGYLGPLEQAERATLKAMKGMGASVDEFGNYTDKAYKRIADARKQMDATFDTMSKNMSREIALYGDVSRAAKLRYDLEVGALRHLSDEQKKYLSDQATRLDRLDDANAAFGAGTNKSAESLRSLRGVAQSAGYQLQDVAVQLQSGTSAFQIFSQQGSQFASAFGPTGAVVGAVIAVAGIVGGILFKAFMDTQKAIKDMEENVKSLTKEYGHLTEAQKGTVNAGAIQVVAELTKKYDEQSKVIEDQTAKLKLLNAEQGTKKMVFGGGQGGGTAVEITVNNTKAMAEAEKELTANTLAHAVALRELQEAQDVTGATKVIREMTDEVSLMGLRGKALYEATAALRGYDEANTKAFTAVMLLKDANKDQEDVKNRIKGLEDETLALQLKNAEIHKNVALQDELAKKLADAKNTRPDGSRISTPEDQEAIAAAELRNTKLKEKNDLDAKSIALYEQQDKAAKDKIKNLERENELFGISSKAQQTEYDIKSGLIKINDGLDSQQAKRILQLSAELDLKERTAVLDKSLEEVVFAGYDNSKGNLESAKMQYELDNGILKVNKSLTKEYYEQQIANKKIVEAKNANKKIDDYLKGQKGDIAKAKLRTDADKLAYDIANGIKFAEEGITDEKKQQAIENQKILDSLARQQALTDSIKSGLTQALIDGAMKGEDAFKTLARSVEGIFSSLVLKPSLDALTDDLSKSLSSVLGSVGTRGADGKMQGASGALGALGPYGAVVAAVGVGLVSSWNAKQDAKFEKMTAEYRQGVQSTGTILGDANKKSESIANAIAALGDTASNTLDVNYGMYQALIDIRTGIGGVAAGFARTIDASGAESKVVTGTTTLGRSAGLLSSASAIDFRKPLRGLGGAGEMIGGFLNGISDSISKALYSKKTSVIDSGIKIMGTNLADIIQSGVIEAFSYADVKTTKRVIGIKASVKVKEATEALGSEFEKQFADVFINAGGALEEASKTFGLNFDPAKFIVDASKLSLKGLTGDALTKEIESFFSATLDTWAKTLTIGTGALEKYQKVGEGAFETIIRLASETNTFTHYIGLMGIKFDLAGVAAIDATQAIAKASGGFDKLSASLNSYYQNFYSEAERSAKGLESIGDVLKTLGIDTVPKTREAFRALVDEAGKHLDTSDGQQYFATLLSLNSAFAELVPATEGANKSFEEIIQTLKDAATTAFDALSKSIANEKSRIEGIVSNASTAKSALDGAITREKDAVTKAHDDRLAAIQDQAKKEQELAQATADANYEAQKNAAKALQEAIKDQISEMEKSISGLSKLFDDINSSINDMTVATDEVTRSRRRAAEFEIETAVANARAGRGVPTDGRINDALSTLKNNPASLYASLEEMTYATAVVQNKLRDLAGLTQDQMTNEQQTLALMQAQLTAAQNSADNLQKVTVAISDASQAQIDSENENYAKQIATLDAMSEAARKQFDALSGIDTSLLSLDDAQKAFSTALLAADFVNAQEQLAKLDALEKNAKAQLDAALGLKTAVDDVATALREFAASLVEVNRAAPTSAVTSSTVSTTATSTAELTSTMADMRTELTDINQATRQNTQDTADILRQMYVEGATV